MTKNGDFHFINSIFLTLKAYFFEGSEDKDLICILARALQEPFTKIGTQTNKVDTFECSISEDIMAQEDISE